VSGVAMLAAGYMASTLYADSGAHYLCPFSWISHFRPLFCFPDHVSGGVSLLGIYVVLCLFLLGNWHGFNRAKKKTHVCSD